MYKYFIFMIYLKLKLQQILINLESINYEKKEFDYK